MNILLVIADLALGGAQQVVINLANEFARQGDRVWLVDIYPELREKGMVIRINKEVNLISYNYNHLKLEKKDRIVDFFLIRCFFIVDKQCKIIAKQVQDL